MVRHGLWYYCHGRSVFTAAPIEIEFHFVANRRRRTLGIR